MSYTPKHNDVPRRASDPVPKKSNKRAAVYAVIAGLLIVAVIAIIIIVVSGANNNSKTVTHTYGNRHDVTVAAGGGAAGGEFTGKWKLDDITSYEFNGTGRGVLHTAENFEFSYSAENGELYIDIDIDDARDSRFEYIFSGDTLTLSRDGSTYTLKKVS